MSTEVDQTSIADPHSVQHSTTNISASPSSNQKLSIFGAKSGFVIPKNKLSGSLVPIFRGDKKLADSNNGVCEESIKLVGRKTKWAPDLTLDTGIRKGRALAYQIRLEQITEQLKSGILHFGEAENENSSSDKILDLEHPDHNEKLKVLEHERREIIGEILKLNPTYKVPPDYKPILKEDQVPLNLKEHPQHNVIAVIFGSGSDTVKRLEKETGAKVQLQGTRVDAEETVLINQGDFTSSDSDAIRKSYKELHFHVSADTYDKIDAAVALIELLLTSVPGNPPPSSATVVSEVVSIPSNTADESPGSSNAITTESMAPSQTSFTGLEKTEFQPQPSPWTVTAQPVITPPATRPDNPFHINNPRNILPSYPPRLQSAMALPGPFMPAVSRPMIPLMRPFIPRPDSAFPPRQSVWPGPGGPVGSQPTAPQFSFPPRGPPIFPPRTSVADARPIASGQLVGPRMSTLSTARPGIPGPTAARPLPRHTSSNFTFQPVFPHNAGPPRPINTPHPLPFRPPAPNWVRPPNMQPMGPRPTEPAPPRASFRPSPFPRQVVHPFRNPVPSMPSNRSLEIPKDSRPLDSPVSGIPGGQQIYDPFSPTSVSNDNRSGSNAGKHESDPEYENLMASVGVK